MTAGGLVEGVEQLAAVGGVVGLDGPEGTAGARRVGQFRAGIGVACI